MPHSRHHHTWYLAPAFLSLIVLQGVQLCTFSSGLTSSVSPSRSLRAQTAVSSPVPTSATTQRPCDFLKLSGPVSVCRGRPGDTELYYSTLSAICENNMKVTVTNLPMTETRGICRPKSEILTLLTAKCAEQQCRYPSVCQKYTLDPQTLTTQPAAYMPTWIGYAKGKCSNGEEVQGRWPSGLPKDQAIAKLQSACDAKARLTCRPGTSADYPNGYHLSCTATIVLSPSTSACKQMRTYPTVTYTCSNGFSGVFKATKDANGVLQCMTPEQLQSKANDLCAPCPQK